MSFQTITRKGSADICHRVMNEKMKCFSCHGHTYLYELVFGFDSMQDIGYPIDFKEIKRVGCDWIDDVLDHGAVLNPHDSILIDAVVKLHGKLWLMSLNGTGEYCNPTVENIAKEVFLAQEVLFQPYNNLWIQSIRLYETPNCFTDCSKGSVTDVERVNFMKANADALIRYREKKGIVIYDDRKTS